MNGSDDEFYRALGFSIRRRRKELRLTQEDLGARLDVPMTRASIANIEAGKQRVLAHTLVELAGILGLGVNELVAPVAIADVGDRELEHELVGKIGEAIGPKAAKALARRVLSAAQRRAGS
jgi:transcriptional regulator with XRE-family HTH domain